MIPMKMSIVADVVVVVVVVVVVAVVVVVVAVVVVVEQSGHQRHFDPIWQFIAILATFVNHLGHSLRPKVSSFESL